jgi:hypothetical protein
MRAHSIPEMGGRVEAYIHCGQRHSLRKGPKTLTLAEIPPEAKKIRSGDKHRYCWAAGLGMARRRRQRDLKLRMAHFKFGPVYQPRLLARLWAWLEKIAAGMKEMIGGAG